MFKLVVLSVLIACTLAGVVPKQPTTNKARDESPSVKSVPMHSSTSGNQKLVEKPNQKAGEKADVKQAEASKPQEKSVKKDESKLPLKKGEQLSQEKSLKPSASRDAGAAAAKTEKLASSSVKEAPKAQPALAEASKDKSKKPGQ